MPQTIENYTPQSSAENLRKQAWIAWSVGFVLVFTWVFAILLAPVAEANNLTNISHSIYGFFSYLCHQIDSRSFHIENHSFAVCSRCFGVYFGLLFGFIIYPVLRAVNETEPLSRIWLFLALVPIGVDWTLGVFGIWENTHWSRFVTGLTLGVVCAVFIIPAVVEIFQLLRRRKQ